MSTKSFNFNITILKIRHFAYNLKAIIVEYEDVLYRDKYLKPPTDYKVRK
jgi:hypothetical protein